MSVAGQCAGEFREPEPGLLCLSSRAHRVTNAKFRKPSRVLSQSELFSKPNDVKCCRKKKRRVDEEIKKKTRTLGKNF